MKIPRLSLLLTSFVLALLILVALAFTLMPSQKPASALSSNITDLETMPPPMEADYYIVRAYYDDYQMVHDLSTWTEPFEVYSDLGFVVLGVNQADLNLLQVLGFRVEIDEEATRALTEPRPTGPEFGVGGYPTIPGFACYRTVEGTFQTAADIVAAHPTLAQWVDVGNSWEKMNVGGSPGYDMMVLVLTNQTISGPKPKLFVTSSIHAREYTPAELMTRFAEYLVTNYGTDADATWILDHHEIHLMLHANPDGRKQAETGLLWRKNTNENYCSPTSSSRGADLNRNFYYQWSCCGGSSGNQCSDTYRGPSAASEPEIQSIQQYAQAIFPDQRGSGLNDPAPIDATGIYMDIHSYSQLVLWPWGFTFAPTPNGPALQTLGRKFAYFNNYTPFQSPNLYITDGTSIDFGYGDLGVASYVFELGTNFFQDCAYFENTLIPGNMPALLYAAKTTRTPYITPQGPDALNLFLSALSVPHGMPVTLNATLNDTRFNNSQGAEPVDQIAAAEYYIDVPSWITTTTPIAYPMSPVDGNFNSSVENATATIDTSNLSIGQHIIFVRGRDNDANQYWGVPSAIFLTVEPPLVEGSLIKTANVTTTLTGEVFTYTLQQTFSLSGTHAYSLTLRDPLVPLVTVLTESIRLNGTPAPELYDPSQQAVHLTETGLFTDSRELTITFQVITNPAPPNTPITNMFTTTTYVDGEQVFLGDFPIAIVHVGDSGDPWLLLEKKSSHEFPIPGEVFTYTLSAQLLLTSTHNYSLTLNDFLPPEVIVLTDTIQLNETLTPHLYDSIAHAITGTVTGTFTDTGWITITFQAILTEDVEPEVQIINTVSANAWVDGQPAMYGGDASVAITPPWAYIIYLPAIIRE